MDEEKYRRRRGWIKIHCIDVETKQITAYEVTDEQTQVETAYSTFKRYFGEFVSAKKWDYMVKEIAAKAWIYNSLRAVLC